MSEEYAPELLNISARLIQIAAEMSQSIPDPGPTPDPSLPKDDQPGWKLLWAEDFNTPTPVGSWGGPDKVPAPYDQKFVVYNDGWPDTNAQSRPNISSYMPSKCLSTRDSMYICRCFNDGMSHTGTIMVKEPQAGGRFLARFKSDRVRGFKTAWLLWPTTNDWQRNGEIDFPESSLDGPIGGYMHHTNASGAGDQEICMTDVYRDNWHIAEIEWLPAQRCLFKLDGVVVGNYTSRVPDKPMWWVIQTEANIGGPDATRNDEGYVYVDWLAVYQPA